MNSTIKQALLKFILSCIIYFAMSLLLSSFAIFDTNYPILQNFLVNFSFLPLIFLGMIIEPLYKNVFSQTKILKCTMVIIFIIFIVIYAYFLNEINFIANL